MIYKISWNVFDADGSKHFVSVEGDDSEQTLANMLAQAKAELAEAGLTSGTSNNVPGGETYDISAVLVGRTKAGDYRAFLYANWSQYVIGSLFENRDKKTQEVTGGGFLDIERYFEPGALRQQEKLVNAPLEQPTDEQPGSYNWHDYAIVPITPFSVCMVPKLDKGGKVVMKVNPITKKETGNPVMVYSHVLVNGQRVPSASASVSAKGGKIELPKDRNAWLAEHILHAVQKKARLLDDENKNPTGAALEGVQQAAAVALLKVADGIQDDIMHAFFACTNKDNLTYGQAVAITGWSNNEAMAKKEVQRIIDSISEATELDNGLPQQDEIPF